MRFKFSLKVTLICSFLILGMCRLSYWQGERYNQKLELIERLNRNLSLPPTPFVEVVAASQGGWEELLHRRVTIAGQFDFEREMVLRNRRVNDDPGVFIITPMKLAGSDLSILVQRGFIRLAESKMPTRTIYQNQINGEILALIKSSQERRLFAPHDDEASPDGPWVDSWLRIDVANMQKQLPYPVLPVFLELMPLEAKTASVEELTSQMIRSDATKDDMLMLPMRMNTMDKPKEIDRDYPVPVFDTVIPPGRHLGYVYEWGMMAVLTAFIGLALQLRRKG